MTELLLSWRGAVLAQFILTWLAIYFMFMRPRESNTRRANFRSEDRFHSQFKGWVRTGGKRHAIRGVDLNGSGALVISRVEMPAGSLVFLCLESEGLMGWAAVRHSVRRGMFAYQAGLEFRGALMRAPEGDWQFTSVGGT